MTRPQFADELVHQVLEFLRVLGLQNLVSPCPGEPRPVFAIELGIEVLLLDSLACPVEYGSPLLMTKLHVSLTR